MISSAQLLGVQRHWLLPRKAVQVKGGGLTLGRSSPRWKENEATITSTNWTFALGRRLGYLYEAMDESCSAKGAIEPQHGKPVHSFTTLFPDLATVCLNTVTPTDPVLRSLSDVTTPTPVQHRAFDLLVVSHQIAAL